MVRVTLNARPYHTNFKSVFFRDTILGEILATSSSIITFWINSNVLERLWGYLKLRM